MSRRGRYVILVLVAGGILGLTGCLDSAPHTNPLDPLAENFRNSGVVEGQIRRYYVPQGMAGARVQIAGDSLKLTVPTQSEGRYRVEGVPSGDYRLTAVKSGYASVSDTIEVEPGTTLTRDFRLNGLPAFARIRVQSVHFDQWGPGEEYRLDVSVQATDPDGSGDVNEVWLDIPSLATSDTRQQINQPGPSPPRYVVRLLDSDLPVSSLHELVGRRLELNVQNLVGATQDSLTQLVWVVEQIPDPISPVNFDMLQTSRPTVEWQGVGVRYESTYTVKVVRNFENGVDPVVLTMSGIDEDSTAVRASQDLSSGTYYWTVAVIDSYGNRGRSKEATFQIDN